MLNGLYTLTRGMIALEKGKDITANNLANSTTPGFKAEEAVYQSFPEILMSRIDEKGSTVIGSEGRGSKLAATYINFRPGSLERTDNPLDLAIEGSGFFVVQAPWGLAYTRGGHFTQDQLGRLVTEDGLPVLGENGFIETDGERINVGEDGTIMINEEIVNKLQVVDFLNPQQLEKVGGNLFRAPDDIQIIGANAIVRQGFIETSNVNIITGMTQLITAARLYEMNQKAIQSQNETLSKAVNEVGRTNG